MSPPPLSPYPKTPGQWGLYMGSDTYGTPGSAKTFTDNNISNYHNHSYKLVYTDEGTNEIMYPMSQSY